MAETAESGGTVGRIKELERGETETASEREMGQRCFGVCARALRTEEGGGVAAVVNGSFPSPPQHKRRRSGPVARQDSGGGDRGMTGKGEGKEDVPPWSGWYRPRPF